MAANKMKLNLTTSSAPASVPCGRDLVQRFYSCCPPRNLDPSRIALADAPNCGYYGLPTCIVECRVAIIMRTTVVAEPDNRRDKGNRDSNFCKSSHDASILR